MNVVGLIPFVGVEVKPVGADAQNGGHSASLPGTAGPVAVAINDNGVSSNSTSEGFNSYRNFVAHDLRFFDYAQGKL